MKERNRFSSLLKHLMAVAKLKNYTLAKELQYDVSYISKWISGQMLPGAKTETTVMQGIARCVVRDGCAQGHDTLMSDYQVGSDADLEGAIYDHLMAEYNYVRDTQKDTGNTIAPKTSFYPKLNMPQYIAKMHHPILRRVKSLEVMALIDLMAIDREFRLQIASLENGMITEQYTFPDVHFSMIIDLGSDPLDYIYDVVFLVNMLTNMTHIDFKLYGAKQAIGRAMFTVKDEFAITGMMMESNVCMSVTVTEEQNNIDSFYRYIHSLCSRERLLIRRTDMREMMMKNDYVRMLLSPNHRLTLGHITEHFLSDGLFEEIMTQLAQTYNIKEWSDVSAEDIRWAHALTGRSYQEAPVRIVFMGVAFSEFAMTGELDFFNLKVTLTPAQRLRLITELRDTLQQHENISLRLVYGRLTADFLYMSNQCVYLSDGTSYLRLNGGGRTNSLHIINHADMKSAFHCFFEEIWKQDQELVISDRRAILQYIDHTIQQIDMISQLKRTEKSGEI